MCTWTVSARRRTTQTVARSMPIERMCIYLISFWASSVCPWWFVWVSCMSCTGLTMSHLQKVLSTHKADNQGFSYCQRSSFSKLDQKKSFFWASLRPHSVLLGDQWILVVTFKLGWWQDQVDLRGSPFHLFTKSWVNNVWKQTHGEEKRETDTSCLALAEEQALYLDYREL